MTARRADAAARLAADAVDARIGSTLTVVGAERSADVHARPRGVAVLRAVTGVGVLASEHAGAVSRTIAPVTRPTLLRLTAHAVLALAARALRDPIARATELQQGGRCGAHVRLVCSRSAQPGVRRRDRGLVLLRWLGSLARLVGWLGQRPTVDLDPRAVAAVHATSNTRVLESGGLLDSGAWLLDWSACQRETERQCRDSTTASSQNE